MEWLIGAAAVLYNGVLWVFMRATQESEYGYGRIPPRSARFPYMQDFWTNGWFGDLLAFSLIDLGVIAAAYAKGLTWDWVILTAVAGYLATRLFYGLATKPKRQRPD